MLENKCVLSGHEANVQLCQVVDDPVYQVKCPACGLYNITIQAYRDLKGQAVPHDRFYLLSAVIRRNSDRKKLITLAPDNLQQLIDQVVPPRDPQEILDRVVAYVAQNATTFSSSVKVEPERDYPLFVAKDAVDLATILSEGTREGLLVKSGYDLKLTLLDGWQRYDEIRRRLPDSSQAFVAMWFDKSLDVIWEEGFKQGLVEAGYRPLRIDKKDFNDKIDDQIVAEIRRSGLVVADVTGHRAGVYFEAGFAMGLGIPVIWTCREDEIGKAHFDTRQYNHIVWNEAQDLREKLVNRIRATLPSLPSSKR